MFFILQKQVILQMPDVYLSVLISIVYFKKWSFHKLVPSFTWNTTLGEHLDHHVDCY